MRSIGLYDRQMYISEFCLGYSPSVCPSYAPGPETHTYNVGVCELQLLLTKSFCVFGGGKGGIVKLLK